MVNEATFLAWQERQATAVLAQIEQILTAHATSPEQQARYLGVIRTYWRAVQPGYHLPFCTWLPLYVYRAVIGDEGGGFGGPVETAVSVAAISTIAWLGAAFYDDLTDEEIPNAWQHLSDAEVTMTAFALMSVIPLAAIDSLDLTMPQRHALRSTLSQGLLRGLAGQEGDLATAKRDDVTLPMIEQIVLGKSGAMTAFCAAFGAIAAGAEPEIVTAYSDYGEALGMVHQISSDAADIFHKARSQDLATGIKNIQTVACLDQLNGAERADFLQLLVEARTSAEAQTAVRQQLRQKRMSLPWMDMAYRYAQQANNALALAQPLPILDTVLRQLVDERTPEIDARALLAYRLRLGA
ncbi:MAG: polyprenyl synthetase family protein [Chloroflexota bacterium]